MNIKLLMQLGYISYIALNFIYNTFIVFMDNYKVGVNR